MLQTLTLMKHLRRKLFHTRLNNLLESQLAFAIQLKISSIHASVGTIDVCQLNCCTDFNAFSTMATSVVWFEEHEEHGNMRLPFYAE